MLNLYSWQHDDFNKLNQLKHRLPTAILLAGTNAIGTHNLALNFIAAILCNKPLDNGNYCGICSSCILINQAIHPDLFYLNSDNDETIKNKSINVVKVRESINFVSTTPNSSALKIVFVENANLLTSSSANALLKILEEPPHYVVFILLSDNIKTILPTIRSRCHTFRVSKPNCEESLQYLTKNNIHNNNFWLGYYQNCPIFDAIITDEQLDLIISTLSMPSIDNIFNLTQTFDGKTISFSFVLEFIYKWMCDLALISSMASPQYFSQYIDKMNPLIAKLNQEKLFYVADQLNFLIKWQNHPLNYRLQIENILFQYQNIFSTKPYT